MNRHADDLTQMTALVQARYEQEQMSFAKLVAEENRLRAELSRLDEMYRASQAPDGSVTQMRAIGADVIWQGWVGRSKTTLNIKLAQVLARKGVHQAAVRRAYGKVLVVSEMRDVARQEVQQEAARRQLDHAIALALAGQ